ncbi:hypothetical protein NEPAR04_1242 [Nematocida parisii]|nr:hypothetical protein NEPAR08_1312 [Nematocida parisii]KAI5128561.1 hypothetical protein NEPAR03_1368 [Nematocida parisii]KAI5141859.1 hypothetical protein NEPAR04_1242 [Nematocida parisii]
MEKRCTTIRSNKYVLSTILTKKYIMALLLLIQTAYSHVGMSDAKEIDKMVLGSKNNIAINSNGDLSSIKGYILHKCGYMQNLRYYLSYIIEIEPDYIETNTTTLNRCTRYLLNYIYNCPEKCTYLREFNQQLINMFPSEKGRLSIESESYDSFTRFLRECKNKLDGLYVLASLFLLSEGVKMPIEIVNGLDKKNSLVLKKNGEFGFRINLPMNIMSTSGNLVYQQKTEDIVNFFKNSEEGDSLKVPCNFLFHYSYYELSKGNFLFGPRFLIQSYFFEYIDTVDMYKDFVGIVYELINEQMPINMHYPSTKAEKKVINAFYWIFIEKRNSWRIKTPYYVEEILKIENMWNNTGSQTPSLHKEVRPMHSPAPSYIQRKDRNGMTEDNYIEKVLFDLFVCFTFNQYINKHSTSHLPSPSSQLKSFFDKNIHKIQNETPTLHSEWCEAVDALSSKGIFYTDSKKQIEFGLLNMLFSIEELAGTNQELRNSIACLLIIINRKHIEKSDQTEIQNNLKNVFKSLSLNKSIEVECKNLKLEKTESGKLEIFTKCNTPIVITYSEYPFHSYRCLEIEVPHITSNFVPASSDNRDIFDIKYIGSELWDIITPEKSPDGDAKWHIEQYIDIEHDKIAHAIDREYNFINKIVYSLHDGYNGIPNSLMLWGSLDCIMYKAKIVEVFLIHSSYETLSITNPMVQFTSKLIDSVPLDDPRVRKIMLRGCLYNKNFGLYYPQIKYDVEEILEPYMGVTCVLGSMALIKPLFSSDIHHKAIANSFVSFANFLKKHRSSRERYIIFGSNDLCRKIIKENLRYTIKEEDMKFILNSIQRNTDVTGDYCADNIFMAWLFHIGSLDEDIPVKITRAVYGYIKCKNLTENIKILLRAECINSTVKNVLSLLIRKKSKLLESDEHLFGVIEKYQKILDFAKKLSSSD